MEKYICLVCNIEFFRKKRKYTAYCTRKCFNKRICYQTFYAIASDEEKIERLKKLYESKVIKRSENECWEWIGNKRLNGYGRITFNRKGLIASRASYIINKGPIQDGLMVMHSCDNPPCTNPNHLSLGTAKDNTIDAITKGLRKNTKRGNNHPNSKLDEERVLEIKKLLRDIGYGAGPYITKKFNIHNMTLSDIRRNVTWKHIKLKD